MAAMQVSANSKIPILRPQKSAVAPALASFIEAETRTEASDVYFFDRRAPDSVESLTAKVAHLRSLGSKAKVPQELQNLPPRSALQEANKLSPTEKAQLQGWLQAQEDLLLLSELPYRTSDGVTRTAELTASPMDLQLKAATQGWDFDKKTGLPLADVVVVGGGPGGLTSAFQLREHGKNVVLFEAGHIGQSFSDAGAAGTHFMRTGGATNDLAAYRDLKKTWDHPLSLFENRRDFHQRALRADEAIVEKTGLEALGQTDARQDLKSGERRAIFFQHMTHIASDLAASDSCSVSEHSRVKPPRRREDGLWEVESEIGHKVVARNLVLATGQVGSGGGAARMTTQMEELSRDNPGRYLILKNDWELWNQAEDFEKHLETLKGADHNQTSLIVTDRLLGQQPVQLALARMEPGKRVAVVGGGESAAKAVLEILRQNPELKVDLYTSKKVLPSQLQVPDSEVDFDVWREQEFEGSYATESLKRFKKFGTPVSLHAVKDLFELEAAGKVRIREMGERFNQDSVRLTPRANGSTSLELLSQAARDSLLDSRGEFEESGIYPDGAALESAIDFPSADMFVMAVGYDKKKNHANPLYQGLQEQGVLEMGGRGSPVLNERGMASTKADNLFFVTAGAVAKSSDTTIPGNRGRALKVAEFITGIAQVKEDVQYASLRPIGHTEESAKQWEQNILEELKERESEDREGRRVWRNEQMMFPATRSLPTIHLHERAETGDLSQVEKMVYARGLELEHHMRDNFGVEQVTRLELKEYLTKTSPDSELSLD